MFIIPDTNFLIYCAKYKIFHEFERFNAAILVPEQVLLELKTLVGRAEKGADKEAAELALKFLKNLDEKGKIKVEKIDEKNADNAIYKLALARKSEGVRVATHDRMLMKKLKKAEINLIRVRQKKYFIEE